MHADCADLWSQEQCPERGSWSVDHCWCCLCPSLLKTFYYKKTNKHGKKWVSEKVFSPQTGVQDIETLSLESRGLVLHSKQREGKQKCLGIAVLREEVMQGVVATSPMSLWGNLVNWLTNKIIPNICSKVLHFKEFPLSKVSFVYFKCSFCNTTPCRQEAFMISVYNAFRYHMGSAAFGAFIIAVPWEQSMLWPVHPVAFRGWITCAFHGNKWRPKKEGLKKQAQDEETL